MSLQYTRWFSPSERPKRHGLYIIKCGAESESWHMAFWNGRWWMGAESPHYEMDTMDVVGGPGSERDYWWRGLTAEL